LSTNIRLETPNDNEGIHQVTVAAFFDAPHTDHTEQFIVQALRASGELRISLVAENSTAIVGHVALSAVAISDGSIGWFGLGPLSVIPDEQGKGIGSKLVLAALEELRKLNASGCVLLGDPDYYHRFGFKAIDGLVFTGVQAEYFQALLFQGSYPQGAVTYHASFSAQAESGFE